MGKVCMYCLEEYKNDEVMSDYRTSDVGLYQECPKRACEGKVYTIDDGILPTIVVLNSKGYVTNSSCAGHQLEEGTECYIEFSNELSSLPSIPEGFKLRMRTANGKRHLAIYKKIEVENPAEQFEEMIELWKTLYDWSLDLEFNLDGLELIFFDIDGSEVSYSFLDFFDKDAAKPKEKEENKKTVLNFDKLKENSQKASIKLSSKTEEAEAASKEDEKENDNAEAKKEPKPEAPKKKRGRPKKNTD